MRFRRSLMVALMATAALTLTTATPSQAHAPFVVGYLNGTGVVNSVQGHTLDISATFVNGVGTGNLTLDGSPMIITCLKVFSDLTGHHHYMLSASPSILTGQGLVFISIQDYASGTDRLGVGPVIDPTSPCQAKISDYPIVAGPDFTTT